MSSSQTRAQVMHDLSIQFRYVSANSVLFSQVVADKVGLHPTDTECLDYLLLNGASTAGQLATLTGLTTGAVTAVIDRLEKAGYVKREHDAKDRRKVLVVPNEEKAYREIGQYSMRMQTVFDTTCEGMTDEELAVVLRFIAKANSLVADAVADVRNAK
jgi:DNA-binding MarR family transcriptional regulator